MHEDPGLGQFRQTDRVARPDHRLRVLHEHVEGARLALRMLPVIADAAQDLARARQGRAQSDAVERLGLAVRRELFEDRAQPLELVDDALHRQLRRVALRDMAADIDDPALGQQSRPRLRIPRILEQNQLHVALPLPVGCMLPPICRTRKSVRFGATEPPTAPAKAGIHPAIVSGSEKWIPAFAGTAEGW